MRFDLKKSILILIACAAVVPIIKVQAATSPEGIFKARRLFRIITGTPILNNDPRLVAMADLIDNGEEKKAAAIATDDAYFYQVTVKNMAAGMSNKSETPYVPLDDFQATFIGAVRDDLDARTLLTGNYIYRGAYEGQSIQPEVSRRDNKHYENIDNSGLDYKSLLVRQEPQWQGLRNSAGLLTTRAWAAAHYSAGTNRRAVVFAFQEFLCAPIDNWKTPNMPAEYIGRDVDRAPGKNPKVFQDQCKTCHAGMDAMRGAFSAMDYINDSFVELPDGRPAPKYSRGASKYPKGFVTKDDSWWNIIAEAQPTLGFKGSTDGKGIKAFGEMLANSEAFKGCMAFKAFTSVCQRQPLAKDFAVLNVAARNFEKNNFNLKKLFQEIAVQPACIGE